MNSLRQLAKGFLPTINGKRGHKETLKFLGSGTYGDVHLVQDRKLGPIAVKCFKEKTEDGLSQSVVREIAVYGRIALYSHIFGNNRRVFPVPYGVVWLDNMVSMEMSYEGTMFTQTILDKIPPKDSYKIAWKIIDATYYIQTFLGVFHRDIKLCNISRRSDGNVCMFDWGVSRTIDRHIETTSEFTSPCQTFTYRAPEVFLGKMSYGPEADVWSLGVFVLNLWSKKWKPAVTETDQLECYFKTFGVPSDDDWPEFKDLCSDYDTYRTKYTNARNWPDDINDAQIAFLDTMFVYNPEKRPDVAKLRKLFVEMFANNTCEKMDTRECMTKIEVDKVIMNIFRKEYDMLPESFRNNTRPSLFSWLFDLNEKCYQPNMRVVAHAMSIFDRFVTLTSVKKKSFRFGKVFEKSSNTNDVVEVGKQCTEKKNKFTFHNQYTFMDVRLEDVDIWEWRMWCVASLVIASKSIERYCIEVFDIVPEYNNAYKGEHAECDTNKLTHERLAECEKVILQRTGYFVDDLSAFWFWMHTDEYDKLLKKTKNIEEFYNESISVMKNLEGL